MPSKTPREVDFARGGVPGLRRRLMGMERGWFAKQKSYFGILRRIPEELWVELVDMLPRCYCGRLVSPHRAIAARAKSAYCTTKCQQRMTARKAAARYKERNREQLAIAESVWQAGIE